MFALKHLRSHSKHSRRQRLKKQLRFEPLEKRQLLATFAVNSTAPDLDGNLTDGICDTGSNSPDTDPPFIKTGICTFAAAAMQADHDSGRDTITFGEIGGGESPVISVGRGLSILHPVTVDGTTHASGRVAIDGSLGFFDGAIVSGLAIFGHDAHLTLGVGNTVTNTYVGFNATGEDGASDDSGKIRVQGNDNVIGGAEAGDRNVIGGGLEISGNQNNVIGNYVGVDATGATPSPASGVVFISGEANALGGAEDGEGNIFASGIISDATMLTIQGNYIGTNAEGTDAIRPGVGNIGISVRTGSDVKIGGEEEGAGNLISGLHFGVFVGAAASEVKVWGNKIGTNKVGDEAIPNAEAGIQIGTSLLFSSPADIQIGGDTPEKGNLISGNSKGIALASYQGNALVVENNWIGTTADGTGPLGNEFGISVENSSDLVIGGEHGNVISANKAGVQLSGSASKEVHVLGNLVGTSPDGTMDLGNVTGVRIINGANNNKIGGRHPETPSGPVYGNVISGSDALIEESLWGVGVWIIGSDNNVVQGNRIGTNAAGTDAIGNEGEGVLVFESSNTIIGGTEESLGNLISGNATGILLWSPTIEDKVTGTLIQGNRVGTNAAASSAIGNANWGVHLTGYVEENEIGGPDASARNIISGNSRDGILLFGEETKTNKIHGNFVGTNLDGSGAIPNGQAGILVENSGENYLGLRESTTFSRNVISGNLGPGIEIKGALAKSNTIEANLVGLDASGKTALPNLQGIVLSDAAENIVGGIEQGDANYISGNKENGILIEGTGATQNILLQNYVGLNLASDAAVANKLNGIVIDGAPGNEIGKLIDTTLMGNFVSGNEKNGILLQGSEAQQNIIRANTIGLSPTGNEKFPNSENGIHILNAPNNLIGSYISSNGSSLSPQGNIVSGNTEAGVLIEGPASTGNQLFGNGIGTNLLGRLNSDPLDLGNGENGVEILNASGNWIGQNAEIDGFGAGQLTSAIPVTALLPEKPPANVLAGNRFRGTRISGSSENNRILGNSIFGNSVGSIDLGPLGRTENDNANLDSDTGSNSLQNYPEITSLVVLAGSSELQISAMLISEPSSEFLVQTFASSNPGFDGEAEMLMDTRVVSTDPTGTAAFTVAVPKPTSGQGGKVIFTMTATNAAGDTSELSPSATAPDLVIRPFQISVSDIEWDGREILWEHDIEICNDGGRAVEDATLSVQGSDGTSLLVNPGQTYDFAAGPNSCTTVPLQWNLTDSLKSGQGTSDLKVTATIDPDDSISELSEDNIVEVSRFLNVLPRFDSQSVETEFKPGYFISGISMMNEVAVEDIDWNGDLTGKTDTGSVEKKLTFEAGSKQDGAVVTSTFAEVFDFDIGNDLAIGPNEITVNAATFSEFKEATWFQTTHLLNIPSWLGGNILNGKEDGDYGEREAVYTQKFGFPGAVTEGFFGVPASEIKVAKGDIGPQIGKYELAFEYRSNGDGTVSGKAPWSAKVADREAIPTSFITLAGTVNPLDNAVFLQKLEATWSTSGEKELPKVRLAPPFSMFQVFAVAQGGVDVKVGVEQLKDGGLNWLPIEVGLSGGVVGMVSAGADSLVSVGGGIGAALNPTFKLSFEGCILDKLTANMILRAQASAFGYAAEYQVNIPDPPLELFGCEGSGDGEHSGSSSADGEFSPPIIKLSKSTAGDWFGTLNSAGIPDIRYEFAAPSIAHHEDGTKTLVWVDEDPSLPDHQRLEILSSRFENGAWQSPLRITNNSAFDMQPTVTKLPGGDALAVWTRAGELLSPSDDPYSNLTTYDLFWSRFDRTSGEWTTPQNLTNGFGIDFLPNLTSSSSGATLGYFNDADGDTSLFPNDSKSIANTLFHREYDAANNTWSSPITVAENIDGQSAPQIVQGDFGDGIDAVAVWNENIDGLSGGQRQRVAVARSLAFEPSVLLLDEPVSDVTSIARTDAGLAIAWVETEVAQSGSEDTVDQLWIRSFSDGQFSEPEKVHESDAIGEPNITVDSQGRIHLTWIETIGSEVQIMTTVKSTEQSPWGVPQSVTNTSDMPWWIMPWVNEDEVRVLHLNREVSSVKDGGEGEDGLQIGTLIELSNPSLSFATEQLAPDLQVSALWYTTPQGDLIVQPSPGQDVIVNGIVSNVGAFTAPASTTALTHSGNLLESQLLESIEPGTERRITFEITLPSDITDTFTTTMIADQGNAIDESDEENNSAAISAFKPDLAVTRISHERIGDELNVVARVQNIGIAPTSEETPVALRLDELIGGQDLLLNTVSALPAGGSAEIRFTITDATSVLGNIRKAFVVVDPNGVESTDLVPHPHGDSNTGNNFQFTTLVTTQTVWSNPANPLDVNQDASVSPIDALLIITDLNANGGRELLPFLAQDSSALLDTSGDNFASPLDALLVINDLNSNGEGELIRSASITDRIFEEYAAEVEAAPEIQMPQIEEFFTPSKRRR